MPGSKRHVLCEFSYDDVRKLHIKEEKLKKFLSFDKVNRSKQLLVKKEIRKLRKESGEKKKGRGARQVRARDRKKIRVVFKKS